MTNEQKLAELYYKLPLPTAFGPKNRLVAESGLKKDVVDSWLRGQDPYTLYKATRRRFPRNHVHVTNIDELFEADLCDFSSLSKHNDNFKYILVVICAFSKYAWCEALKTKTGLEVSRAFQRIFDKSGRIPVYLRTDKGTEFRAREVQNLFKRLGIQFFVAHNPDIKASLAERFILTLKKLLFRYFEHAKSNRYVDQLDAIVARYNNSFHRSIGMAPREVTEDRVLEVYRNLYKNKALGRSTKRPAFKVGDHVRISKEKGVFDKSYIGGFSKEIFVVRQVIPHTQIVYRLSDLNGESIEGTFYEKELQHVNLPDTFEIDKIIKSKGSGARKQLFVSWKGYPKSFNSWVLAKDVVST